MSGCSANDEDPSHERAKRLNFQVYDYRNEVNLIERFHLQGVTKPFPVFGVPQAATTGGFDRYGNEPMSHPW